MPTDSATRTVEVAAPFADVLATIRDVESQVDWIPEILEAELLEVYEGDELPATARFKASATVGTDEYTLSYEHTDNTMSWTMVEGRMQTGQEGCYTLVELGAGPDLGDLRADHPPQPAAAGLRPAPGHRGPGRQHPDRSAAALRGHVVRLRARPRKG